MRTGMLLFCLGLASISRLSALPAVPGWTLPSLTLISFVALCLLAIMRLPGAGGRSPGQWATVHSLGILLLCFVLGASWALSRAAWQMARVLPASLEGEDFWVSGQVVSVPRVDQRARQFDLRVSDNCFQLLPEPCVDQPRILVGSLIRLNDYAATPADTPIEAGQWWQLRVRLNRPHGLANPGVADQEARWFQQGIVARGYVRETAFNRQLPPGKSTLQSWRFALLARLDHAMSDYTRPFRQPGLIQALVLGERTAISTEQWLLFSATGTNHLMVISGLHVGFVALAAWWLLNLAWRLSSWLLLHYPAQQAGAWAAILAALVYAMLAGFSLPTQRALIMVTVLMGGQLSGRRLAPSFSLLLAASAVLAHDPLSVTQAGFWLSFGAVAALLSGFSGYRRLNTGRGASLWCYLWYNWGHAQWIVSVGLLVPLIVWTGQVSLISPLVNVLAIPLVSLLVVPLALLGSLLLLVWPPLAVLLLWLADSLLVALLNGLQWVVSLAPVLWPAPAITPAMALLVLMGSVLLLMPAGVLPRLLALPFFSLLIWPPAPQRPDPGHAQIQFLDVGQGLAVVVHTRHHHLLFDTGPGSSGQYDIGQAVILPYLRHRSIRALDAVVVSHWHQDHSGGLDSILQAIPVNRRLAGTAHSTQAQQHGFEACRAGESWRWDGVEFSILHPSGQSYRGENDNSCVIQVSAGKHSLLLTGDIELAAERDLVQRHATQLQSEVLQAPHHGSHTSSSPALLRVVQPSLVVVSAGYRNRFSHPSELVLSRFAEQGSVVYQTAHTGAVQIELGGPGEPRISSLHRLHQRRYWHNSVN